MVHSLTWEGSHVAGPPGEQHAPVTSLWNICTNVRRLSAVSVSIERHPPRMTTTPTLTPRLVMSGGRLAACSALSCLMGQKGGWVSSTGAPGAGLAGARCRHSLSPLQRAVTWSGVRSSCTDQIFTIRSCTVLACGPERTEDHAGPGPRVEMQAVHDTLRELGQAGGGRGPVHQVHKNSFCCHRSRCLKS